MAGGGGRVLLGFLDEVMEKDVDQFTTSKIGGRPVGCVLCL